MPVKAVFSQMRHRSSASDAPMLNQCGQALAWPVRVRTKPLRGLVLRSFERHTAQAEAFAHNPGTATVIVCRAYVTFIFITPLNGAPSFRLQNSRKRPQKTAPALNFLFLPLFFAFLSVKNSNDEGLTSR
jgi:hypothetical protein